MNSIVMFLFFSSPFFIGFVVGVPYVPIRSCESHLPGLERPVRFGHDSDCLPPTWITHATAEPHLAKTYLLFFARRTIDCGDFMCSNWCSIFCFVWFPGRLDVVDVSWFFQFSLLFIFPHARGWAHPLHHRQCADKLRELYVLLKIHWAFLNYGFPMPVLRNYCRVLTNAFDVVSRVNVTPSTCFSDDPFRAYNVTFSSDVCNIAGSAGQAPPKRQSLGPILEC